MILYLKRKIIIDTFGNPVKFAMVLYPSKEICESELDCDIYCTTGKTIGYLTSYEKAERLEQYFNEACDKMRCDFF